MYASATLRHAIAEAVGVLRNGGVVAFPTDTLYGLGADALRAEAVARVFDIKGRSPDMALPVLIESTRDLGMVATGISELVWDLLDRFWPGPLTLIVRKSPKIDPLVTGGKDTIAVRMPNHHVPLRLIKELGGPITGTSANPSGGPDPITAEDVRRLLGSRVDYVVDGGPATAGTPSTVLDVTGARPTVLRRGAIAVDALRPFFPTLLEIA